MKPASQADRRADLATIHVLQKELGLDKDSAEALKRALTGVASSADMSFEQRSKYIGHLKALKKRKLSPDRATQSAYTAKRENVQRSEADAGDQRWSKARALWALMARNGVVQSDTDRALMAYVTRQTRVSHWRFLNGHQINAVIESLKAWCARCKVEVGDAV